MNPTKVSLDNMEKLLISFKQSSCATEILEVEVQILSYAISHLCFSLPISFYTLDLKPGVKRDIILIANLGIILFPTFKKIPGKDCECFTWVIFL